MLKKFIPLCAAVVLSGFLSLTFAANDAPVVNITQDGGYVDNGSVAQDQGQDQDQDQGQGQNDAGQNAQGQDAISPSMDVPSAQQMSMDQRVSRLEQQMANRVRMNMPQQISEMQQTLQQLQGQLQVQQHDITLLNQQQKSFYQDLDQRLNAMQGTQTTAKLTGVASTASTAGAETPAAAGMKDSAAYKHAFQLLLKKQYPQAKLAFASYLQNYPKGSFLANSHYWLGEINLLQKNYAGAQTQFTVVVTKFPKSPKALDARLKLAIVHAQSGKVTLAKTELKKIQKNHPNSTAAQLATIRLQQLEAAVDNVPAGSQLAKQPAKPKVKAAS